MLVEHIKALKNNVPIEHLVYRFVDHTAQWRASVKTFEGDHRRRILIFENKELRDLMDTGGLRRHRRSIIRLWRGVSCATLRERGRTMQSVITQYTSTVKPMHEESSSSRRRNTPT